MFWPEAFEATFGVPPSHLNTSADVRYFGQSHELEIEAGTWPESRRRFESLHRQRFGFDRPSEPIEVVNVRAVAAGSAPLSWGDLPHITKDMDPQRRGSAWERSSLPAGFEVSGPGLIVEDNSAVLLEQGDEMVVLDDGTLQITPG